MGVSLLLVKTVHNIYQVALLLHIMLQEHREENIKQLLDGTMSHLIISFEIFFQNKRLCAKNLKKLYNVFNL